MTLTAQNAQELYNANINEFDMGDDFTMAHKAEIVKEAKEEGLYVAAVDWGLLVVAIKAMM